MRVSIPLVEHTVLFLMLTDGFRAAVAVAAPDDSHMGDSEHAKVRTCDGCGVRMLYLGMLPPIGLKLAVFVFRCFTCNRVRCE
jgi:hypothetical protein